MSELKPCPICGGRFQPFKDNYGKCGAYCTECGMYFGVELECGVELHDGWKAKFDSEEELMDALNRRAQPDNAPLTLEGLREMTDTDWVWLVFPGLPPEENGWHRAKRTYLTYSHEHYGKTWRAYHRKPESEADA